MPATLIDILGPGGAIARRLGAGYEFRPQQLEMAAAVEGAIQGGHNLLVEAGTGVGKSFAYLLPAIDYAVRSKKRVIISTHTISLQEQLIDKDIPLLQAVYPDEFTAILVKGRSNYLCKRRLQQSRGRQTMLFDADAQFESLNLIEEWAEETTDGSLADLPALPAPGVWDRVCAEHGNCLGKKCQFYKDCFWQAARRRMNTGNILVVNHALFFSDLALRMAGINYLPKYDVAILDEAHTVEDVAGGHFGLKVTEAGVFYQLRTLYDMKRGRGLLSVHGAAANNAIRDVIDLHERAAGFFDRVLDWQQTAGRGNGRVRQKHFVENDLSPKLRDLDLHIKAMLPDIQNDEDRSELSAVGEKVSVLGQMFDAILGQTMNDAVYWVEGTARPGPGARGAAPRLSLHAAPVKVADGLRKELFKKMHSVVMTSATLCTAGAARSSNPSSPKPPPMSRAAGPEGSRSHGLETRVTPGGQNGEAHEGWRPVGKQVSGGMDANPKAFAYIKSRLGVVKEKTLQLGSPFDYANQVTLYVEHDLPEPADTARFLPAACVKILKYLRMTQGGAFVLFTSYSMLIDAANRLKPKLDALGFPLLVQGQGMPRKQLLDQFRGTDDAVLFGTSSFWQGIDVQGDRLRNVIIVKLPFAVPDEPVIEARLDEIKRTGGNAFMDYQVPEAIIKLKQGFGRLIRSKTDKGIVVILDSRVKTKRYGSLFLDALPTCKTEG